jgi:hypothetical protein
MTIPINMTLYRLLTKMGADEKEAEEAARMETADLVTKLDLMEMETRLQKVIIQAMLGMTATFAVIVGLFRVFAP